MDFRSRTLTDEAQELTAFSWLLLIPCFLVVSIFLFLNFHESRDRAIEHARLPTAEESRALAKPIPRQILVQWTDSDTIIIDGHEVPLSAAKTALAHENQHDRILPTVIIQAAGNTPTGKVQELILLAQQAGFTRILLREKL